jgi:uncharacterized SAM-binding protein YcdF (DUF218 family)
MTLLKHIFETCASPASILACLPLVAAWLGYREKCRRSLRVCLLLSAALQMIFMSAPLGEILIGRLEQLYPPILAPETLGAVPWIVVLSASGVDHPDTPITSNLSEETLYRLAEAVRVYRRVPKARIVVSGGVLREGERPIAAQMAGYLLSTGIPMQDVLTEATSKDTYQNLLNTQKIVRNDAFFLVTSAYHLRRAMAVSRRLGLKAIACPAYIQTLQYHPAGLSWWEWSRDMLLSISLPSPRRLVLLQRAFHEYAGYVWYEYQGRI